MNEPGKFNYDVPSPETLAGIYVSFSDAEQTPQKQVPAGEPTTPSQGSETAPPRPEDLVGITLTFEDSPSDAHPGRLPPQSPTMPSHPEQLPPGP